MEIEEIINMNGGDLARWLHNNYERISKDIGWDTQKDCKVEFDDLPKKNKSVMLRMAQLIQLEIITPFLLKQSK